MNRYREYWKKNLIDWESKRYGEFAFLNPFSIPLRKRMECCEKILLDLVPLLGPNKIRIHEFGCGSGLLAQRIKLRGLDCQYAGYDISKYGIEKAIGRNLGPKFSFEIQDITNLNQQIEGDISFFLGLSDWLNREENVSLLLSVRSRYLIWSYTLKNNRQLESASYSILRKFRDQAGAKALSWTSNEVDQLFKDCNLQRYIPDQKFSFGPGFISCLVRKDAR